MRVLPVWLLLGWILGRPRLGLRNPPYRRFVAAAAAGLAKLETHGGQLELPRPHRSMKFLSSLAIRNWFFFEIVAERLAVFGRLKGNRFEFQRATAGTLGWLLLAEFAADGAAVSGVAHSS